MNKSYIDILRQVEREHEENSNRTYNSRVLLVDGTNTFIRCWSSIPTMNDIGDHVGGVTGFLKSIGYAIRQTKATRCIVVFDGKNGSNSRKKKIKSYKANRDKNKLRVNRQYADLMTDEDERESMHRQFVWLTELLDVLPVTTMIYDGIEADDVLGYVTRQICTNGEEVVIMSTDKDFLQLVDEKTAVWSPTKKIVYNINKVHEDFGIYPRNLLLYRTLDGDVSDNIPGVKGCGLATVKKMFPDITENKDFTYDDLYRICEAPAKKKPKLFETILSSKQQIADNFDVMQLSDPDIPTNTALKIVSRFREPTYMYNTYELLRVIMKYKIGTAMGDTLGWANDVFSNVITQGKGN